MKRIILMLFPMICFFCLESCSTIFMKVATRQGIDYVSDNIPKIQGRIEIRATKPTYTIISSTCSNATFKQIGGAFADTLASLVSSELLNAGFNAQKGLLMELPNGPYQGFTTENYSKTWPFYLKDVNNREVCSTESFLFVTSNFLKDRLEYNKNHTIITGLLNANVDYTIILFPMKFWCMDASFMGRVYASEYFIGIYNQKGRLVALGQELRSVNNSDVSDLISSVNKYLSETLINFLNQK